MVGWITWASPVHAQDADVPCNPSGDDNDLLYCVWTVEPRFGGMSVDQSDANVLRVFLTGDDPTEEAAARVLAEVNRRWNREFTATTVEAADYTIGELKGWFDTVAADFHEKMTGVDLDEPANRITVMVASLDDQDTVAEHVAGLGVPVEAVQFEEFQILPPDPVPAAQSSGSSAVAGQSLTGTLVPMVGGGEIQNKISGRSVRCSMGFAMGFVNTQGKHEEGFVTAGHCYVTTTTGETFYIHGDFSSTYGVSIWNAYPDGVDAQYVRKTGSQADLGIGLIGRPAQENTTGQAYLNLDVQNPYFEIIGMADPIAGQSVHKVGRATGWTSGTVTSTCSTFLNWNPGWPNHACMAEASYRSEGGDSGGSVFSLNPDGSAMAMGIHHGTLFGEKVFVRIDRVLKKLFYDRGVTDVWLTNDLPPILTNIDITSTPISGNIYQPGETIEFTYTFSEDVTLYPGLPPRVVFAAPGPRYPSAHYDPERSFKAGENKLVFTWEVPNDMQGGIWNGPKVPGNRASIGDLAGNRLVANQLDYGRSAQIGQKSGGPQMEKGTFATGPVEGNNYQPGETIFVATRWNRPVKVDPDNPPHVLIYMNSSPDGVRAEYNHRLSERWGNQTVAFSYQVKTGDEDDDKLWLGNRNDGTTSLRNAAGITDYSGRPASDTWSPASYSRYGAETPSGAPAVSSAGFVFQYSDGQPLIEQFQPGEVVEFRVRFDRPVKVDESNPPWVNLSINSGGQARADYDPTKTAANFEPNLLSFTYVVQDGDRDDDGIWAGPDSLQNPGSITNYAGNAATGGGLGRNTGHNVGDSGAPSITGAKFTSRPLFAGQYQPGEVIEIIVTADEPVLVDAGNPPNLAIQVGGDYPRPTYDAARSQQAGANKLVFAWTVPDGYTDDDGILIGPGDFRNTDGVTDWSSNPINAALPKYYGKDPRHKVGDLGAPVITNVEMSSKAICGGTYRIGETLEFKLTVSEPVTVPAGNEPRLIIRVGDDYRSVAYDRVSSQSAGANHMIFAWEVPAGFAASDGILLGPGALGDTGSIEDGSANPLDPSLHKYWGFDENQVGGPANYFTVDVSNSAPQAGERVALTVQLEAGCTGVASYQWQRQFGGDWRDIGPRAATKEAKFNSAQTVTYRAVVRFISGATVTSEPVSITWR